MSLSSAQLTALASQINTDPNKIGYASANGNVQTIANLGNAISSTLMIARLSMDRDAFVLAIEPAVMALQSATSAIQSKYSPLLSMAEHASVIELDSSNVGYLNSMVTDGLWTQADANAVINQPASDFQTVLGAGVSASPVDVATALSRAAR